MASESSCPRMVMMVLWCKMWLLSLVKKSVLPSSSSTWVVKSLRGRASVVAVIISDQQREAGNKPSRPTHVAPRSMVTTQSRVLLLRLVMMAVMMIFMWRYALMLTTDVVIQFSTAGPMTSNVKVKFKWSRKSLYLWSLEGQVETWDAEDIGNCAENIMYKIHR